jgi:hypothetical protein
MKTSGDYRPTSNATTTDPGGSASGVASALTGPERVLVQDNLGAQNTSALSSGQKTQGVAVSNWTLASGLALPATAHLMTMTIVLRASRSFDGGANTHKVNCRFKNPDGSWSANASTDISQNTGLTNFTTVLDRNVDNLFTPAYVLGPTFVVEAWFSAGPDAMTAATMSLDVMLVRFGYIDDYNTDLVLLPYFVDNARGAAEPLWSNPTFALTENSQGANVQLFNSAIDATAWLWAMYAAQPTLLSLSMVEIQHRVRYQNVTNPGTAVGGVGGPRARWTWLWADGWGQATGGPTPPVPIYTQFGSVQGATNQTWPFPIDVWGEFGTTIADADLSWVGTALKNGKFGQGLVYSFNTTYSSQRLNFYADVARIRVRFMAAVAGGRKALFFRGIP